MHQIVNGIKCNDSSNGNLLPISNANDYSFTETVSSNAVIIGVSEYYMNCFWKEH